MNAAHNLRERLIQLVTSASEEELGQMDASLQAAKEKAARVRRIAGHFGSWADLPAATFELFTMGLHADRQSRRDEL